MKPEISIKKRGRCPTRDKKTYADMPIAENAIVHSVRRLTTRGRSNPHKTNRETDSRMYKLPFATYLCHCGEYHLTSAGRDNLSPVNTMVINGLLENAPSTTRKNIIKLSNYYSYVKKVQSKRQKCIKKRTDRLSRHKKTESKIADAKDKD